MRIPHPTPRPLLIRVKVIPPSPSRIVPEHIRLIARRPALRFAHSILFRSSLCASIVANTYPTRPYQTGLLVSPAHGCRSATNPQEQRFAGKIAHYAALHSCCSAPSLAAMPLNKSIKLVSNHSVRNPRVASWVACGQKIFLRIPTFVSELHNVG